MILSSLSSFNILHLSRSQHLKGHSKRQETELPCRRLRDLRGLPWAARALAGSTTTKLRLSTVRRPLNRTQTKLTTLHSSQHIHSTAAVSGITGQCSVTTSSKHRDTSTDADSPAASRRRNTVSSFLWPATATVSGYIPIRSVTHQCSSSGTTTFRTVSAKATHASKVHNLRQPHADRCQRTRSTDTRNGRTKRSIHAQ